MQYEDEGENDDVSEEVVELVVWPDPLPELSAADRTLLTTTFERFKTSTVHANHLANSLSDLGFDFKFVELFSVVSLQDSRGEMEVEEFLDAVAATQYFATKIKSKKIPPKKPPPSKEEAAAIKIQALHRGKQARNFTKAANPLAKKIKEAESNKDEEQLLELIA